MQFVKLYVSEAGTVKLYEITPTQQITTIGRSPENMIQLLEMRASRLHCQIERTPEGFKLVDLESSNGTCVNGKKVNTSILSFGDVIEIGSVKIQFGEAPVGQVVTHASPIVHAAPHVPSPVRAPHVPVPVRASHAAVPIAPTPEQPVVKPAPSVELGSVETWRRRELVRKLVTAAVILVGAFVLFFIGKKIHGEYIAQKQAKNLIDKAEIAMEDGELQECLTLCDELLKKYPNSDHVAQARSYSNRITHQQEREKLAAKRLIVIDKMAPDMKDQPLRLVEEYTKFITEFAETSAVETAKAKITTIREAITKESEAKLAECGKEIEAALATGNFGLANSLLGKFVLTYEGMPVVFKAEEMRGTINTAANTAFEKLSSDAKELLVKERYETAKQFYRDALGLFEGTLYYFKIQSKLRSIDALASGGQDLILSARVRAARDECLQLAVKADELARNQRYLQAYEMYRAIMNDRLSTPELAEVKKEFELRSLDIKAQAELFENLIACVNSSALSSRTYALGGGITGTMKKATPESIEISFNNESGLIRVQWFNVPPKNFYDLYRRCKLNNDQTYVLGVYCFNNNLTKEGSITFSELVRADSARKPSVDAFLARCRGIAVPEGGFIFFEDAWYTPLEHRYALLRRRVDKILARLKEQDEKVVETALADFKSLMAEPDLTAEFTDTSRERVVASITERRKNLFAALKRIPSIVAVEQRKALKEELNLRRKHALTMIMDENRYPYPYKTDPFAKEHVADFKAWISKQGFDAMTKKELDDYIVKSEGGEYAQVVQVLVDKLVDRVRELWRKPGEGIKLDKNVQEMVNKIKLIDERYLPDLGATVVADEEISVLMGMINQSIDLKTVCLNGTEQGTFDYNKKVWEFNEKTKVSLSDIEKQQIKVTNEYREMMGRRIVAINEKLGRAARKHSDWMVSVGRLSHEQDNPKTRSPSDRVQLEGYGGGASENICVGHDDPEGAHYGWCHSSGHHRNICSDSHTELGVGKSSSYWTQNFGGGGSNFDKLDQTETGTGKKEPPKK
jgi:uncharacterized protein YkwD